MASSSIPAGAHGDPTRRDFLMVASGAMAAVGAIATAWPFINNLNPAADTLAPVRTIDGEVLAVVAARVGSTRLIDNELINRTRRNGRL